MLNESKVLKPNAILHSRLKEHIKTPFLKPHSFISCSAKPPSALYRLWKFQVFQTVTIAELFWCTYVAAFLIWQTAVMYCKKYETIHKVPLVKPKKPPAPA